MEKSGFSMAVVTRGDSLRGIPILTWHFCPSLSVLFNTFANTASDLYALS